MATQLTGARIETRYRALRVYWPVRWRLLWAARSDRRAGPPIGLSIDTTPVLRALFARRDDICEHERTRYLAEVRPLDVRLAEIDAEVPALERELSARTTAVDKAAVKPSDSELTDRRAGEQGLPIELIRQRRIAEWQKKVDVAKSALESVQHDLDALFAEQAEKQARRQHRADVARSRALRFCEHTDRLAAIYRRALVRRHPQRDALIDQWQSYLSPPPAWVSSDDITPPLRTTGAAA